MKVNFTDCRNKEQRSCINDLGFSIQEFIFLHCLLIIALHQALTYFFLKLQTKKIAIKRNYTEKEDSRNTVLTLKPKYI